MTSKIVVNNIEPDAGISTVSILGIATATKFVGDVEGGVTGNVTGNVTGSSGSCTGNAATATVASGITTTASVNTSGIVTATAFVSDTPLSHRNIIVNGAMNVSQRGDFFGNVGQQQYTIDRFITLHSYGNVINVTQTSTSPDGFSRAYKVDCQVADTSIGAAEFMFVRYKIEAQDLQQLAYGTSGAKPITLSFYVRSNVTGTYAICLQQKDNGSKQVNGTYTINSANTWERKTFTFAGDTNGVINNDTGHGLDILWTLVAGSNRTSGSARPTWTAHADADESVGHTANVLSSTSNDWLITGVQLEVGSVATPFEHRSVGEELRRCYRYFQRRTSSDNYQWVSLVSFYTGSEIHGFFDHYETMRASPTLSATTGSNTLAVQRAGGSVAWSTGIIKNGGDLNVTYFYRDGVSLGTSGQCGRCLTWTAGSTITLDAEL